MIRSVAGSITVAIAVILVAVVTFLLLQYYREKSVPFSYSSVIYCAWFVL